MIMKRMLCMLLAIILLMTAGAGALGNASAADPEPEWEYVTDLSYTFYLAASVQDNDHNLYIIGGRLNTGMDAYDTMTVLDLTTMNEITLANMPIGVAGACAAIGDDGLIYVFGGKNLSSSLSFVAAVQIYDPATDSWATGSNMTDPVTLGNAIAMPNGLIYVIGGMNDSALSSVTDHVQIYDPSTDIWTMGEPLPDKLYAGMASALGSNTIVYAGGSDPSLPDSYDTIYNYNVQGDSWTLSSNVLPYAMGAAGTFVGPDCLLYMIGGGQYSTAYSTSGNAVKASIAYDPFTGDFTYLPDMSSARKYLAIGYDAEGNLYAIGGYNGATSIGSVERIHIVDALEVHLGPSTDVDSGGQVVVTADYNFAIAEYAILTAEVDIIDGSSVVVASYLLEAYEVGANAAHFYVNIPQELDDGDYDIRFEEVHSIGTNITGFSLEGYEIAINVTHITTAQDLVDDQNAIIEDLQDQLDDQNETIDDLQQELDDANGAMGDKMDASMGMLLIVLALIAVFLGAIALVLVLRKRA